MYYQFTFLISGTDSKTPKYFYFKAKYFQAFHYIYKLARDCRSRIENVLKNNDKRDEMTEEVFIKIGIVGKFTDADLKLISTGRGKKIQLQNLHSNCFFFICFVF